ncbi:MULTISPECIES: polyprenyl synthetase family protein [unclassified Iodidimonas]|uniref:polyprenyl synthetase family protein n=1 Tax=unclassified Iodidimonas TaxID=2626145 RepID=UPI002482E7C1|nr:MULTISPECIES: farnesyl diphosphate synthase [unclassified Iodidimonas]
MTMTMVQDFSGLEAALGDVSLALGETFDALLPVPESDDGRVVEAMRYALFAGGKRLRPFLLRATADLFGVSLTSSLRAGAAIECIHSYSLVHDDLPAMDDDDLRRGKPTVHKAFDEATAILAGDALLTFAFEILSDESTHADPRVRAQLVSVAARASGHHGMVGGQMLDLAAEHKQLTERDIIRLQQMKTGALIVSAVEMGAVLGKASTHARHALVAYARAMGLAFQIADDLLDATASADEMGKATGKDAAAGKATLVSLWGEEAAREKAEILTDQALSYLKEFGSKAELLREVAQFAIHRRR